MSPLLLLTAASALATSVDIRFEQAFGHRVDNGPGRTNYPSQLAVNSSTGEVYVLDQFFNRIQKFDATGRFLTMWTRDDSLGLAVEPDTGDLWVAVREEDKLQRFSSAGVLEAELGSSGSGAGQFDNPQDVAVNRQNGDLYVLDTGNLRVQVFDRSGAYLRQFTDSQLDEPYGIAIHPKGDFVVVANTAKGQVLKFSLDGTLLARWRDYGSMRRELRWDRDVTIDNDGNIYIADTDNERVQKWDQDGNFLQFFQGPNDLQSGEFHPRAVDVNLNTGEVYVAAAYAHRIDRFSPSGQYLGSFGQRSREGAVFNLITGVSSDPRSGEIFVSDWLDHRIKRFNRNGQFLEQWPPVSPYQFSFEGDPYDHGFETDPTTGMWVIKEDQSFPNAIATDSDGNVWTILGGQAYTTDPRRQSDWRLRCFDRHGKFVRAVGSEDFPSSAQIRGIAVDSVEQTVYVANSDDHYIMKFSWDGTELWRSGRFGADPGEFNFPAGLALDRDNGWLYVVDANNDRVQKLDLDGNFISTFGSTGSGEGQLKVGGFSHVAVGPKGTVFVADTGNSRIAIFEQDGTPIRTFGKAGYDSYGQYAGFGAIWVQGDRLYVGDNSGYEIEVYALTVR